MEALKRWRSGWGYPTTLLCLYGFFSTVKPLEPFLIPYMTGPDKNLTTEQVSNDIFPVWTYSYLSMLVPVFLLTDWLRYKPVVVFQCASLFVTTAMLLWMQGVPAMQAMQAFYGMMTASEVAYFSYIYSVVDLEKYRKVTSYCRSIQLLGSTVGSVLGQLLVSFDLMSYHNILVLTLVLIAIALVISVLLPMPQHSMFFHSKHSRLKTQEGSEQHTDGGVGEGETHSPQVVPNAKAPSKLATKHGEETENSVEGGGEEAGRMGEGIDGRVGGVRERRGGDGAGGGARGEGPQAEASVEAKEGCAQVFLRLWRDFLQCYSSRKLLYWSVWWALASCGYNQIINYVQVLWEHVQPSQNFTIYNGGVEAVSNLFGATTAYGIGFTQVDWAQWGELALGGFSGLGATSLFLMTFTGNIWVCYTGYVVFKSLYMLLITIAMFQIAADMSMERYALIFGANTFGALVLQTVITSIVVDSRGLGLPIIPQFTIYAGYFSVIAVLFSLRGVFTVWRTWKKKHRVSSPAEKPSCSPDPDASLGQRF